VVFFSPSGIASLKKNFPNYKQLNIRWGAYGKTTADAIIEEGLELHLMAPLEGQPSIFNAIENYLKESNLKK
ncbi:MAG: uroporphyrinogen-III synthase, partial [Chitinophagales bacterium]|nr:uroporphyrinogen-III synthase [Chitinophagales bacterium]MDW8272635.1 uroporphyrinogen-III synthase [Chitinophagales bacterium]